MTISNPCAQCGADLGSGSVGGLCPRCLVRIVRAVPREAAPAAEFPSPPTGQAASPTRFGDYELLAELAHGGMGVVWRARQVSANRIVALKMILAGRFANAAEVKRFRAEAEATAQLDHPNIVPIYEVGEHEGLCFFTMKLIEGGSLAQRLPNTEPRTLNTPGRAAESVQYSVSSMQSAALIAKVARAVHHAHQRGILHRDLTPGNILLDAAGEPHVTDFGLAKRLNSTPDSGLQTPDLTLTGAVLGTPGYLAPEQAAGGAKHLTTAADIYSLGAILYEILTGRPPFQGATTLATLQEIQTREPVRPRTLNPQLDPELETICLKCLEKEPARRYNSAASLADDLERFLRHEPIHARPSTTVQRLVKWTRRNPVRAGFIAAFVAVTLLGAGGVLWEWRRAESALRVSQESLWLANSDRAQARRTSRQMGQRLEALKAIGTAAAIRFTEELRTEAIAAMALTDLEDVGDWLPAPTNLVSYAADGSGERVALSLNDGTVEVRHIPDGRLLALVPTGQQRPHLRLDDAGERLLTCDNLGSRVWDLRTTNLLCAVRTPMPEGDRNYRFFGGMDAAISADGRRFAYPDTTSSVAWREIGNDRDLGRFNIIGFPGTLAFSSSGGMLAACTAGTTEIWRLPDQTHLASLKVGGYPMVWNQTEPILAIGCGTEVDVCGLATNEIQRLTTPHMEGVFPSWHPDGNLLASTAWDQVLRLWDPLGGVQLLETTFARPSRFSTNGEWLVVKNARGIGRLKVHVPRECRVFHLPVGRAQNFGVLFTPDDRFLAGLANDEIWIWEVATGRLVAHQPMLADGFTFLSQRAMLIHGNDGVQLWTNTASADGWNLVRQTVITPGGDGRFDGLTFNADHTLLTIMRGRTGEVYNFPSGRLRSSLAGQRLSIGAVFSADSRWLASGYFDNNGRRSSECWLWSVEDGQPVRKIPMGNCEPRFAPDGRWLLIGSEQEYRQYALEGPPATWPLVRTYPRAASGFEIGPLAISDDSKLLALQLHQATFQLVEAATGRELAWLTPLPGAFSLYGPIFSHNSRWFAATSGVGLHVWDLARVRAHLHELKLDWTGPPDLPPPY